MLLNKEQSYLVMYFLLRDYYWETTKNDSLGGMLGDLSPYIAEGYISADPAAWEDWIDSVKKVSDNNLLKHEEALQAIIVFLEFYMTEFGFNIGWILEDIINLSHKRKEWMSFVDKAIQISRAY